MVMPSTVKDWMWWVSLVGTVLLIATFGMGALSLKKSGCLGQVTKSMWIPAVLFVCIQLITLMVTKFAGDDPIPEVELVPPEEVVIPAPPDLEDLGDDMEGDDMEGDGMEDEE